MKGIVFTELLEMVEQKFGYEMVDHIITASGAESNGVYTAVGTYSSKELFGLVHALHLKSEISIPDLLKTFGRYLFGTFQTNYGVFFTNASNAFEFLESIENYIHVEVRKLYPDAELPSFTSERVSDKQLHLVYTSERKMADFAEGLIEKTMEHYQEPATISRKQMDEEGKVVQFTITKE